MDVSAGFWFLYNLTSWYTPYPLLYQEGVDVVSWVGWVQVQPVPLDLCLDGSFQNFRVAEDTVVRPRQMFHQCWEGIIQLFVEEERGALDQNPKRNFCRQAGTTIP